MARKSSKPNYRTFSDVETVVVPKTDRGQLRRNDAGEFFARDWTDGTFSCCSDELERRLLDVGVKAGVPVGIRRERYHGNSVIWHVRLLGASTVSPPKQQTNGHATPADVTWANLPSEKYAPMPASNGHTPNTLEDQLKASIALVQAEKPREPKNLLERAAVAAVDAAIFVEGYAAKHGRPFTVPAESIAAWASTLFINAR